MISAKEKNKAGKKRNGERLDLILNRVVGEDLTEKVIFEWREGEKSRGSQGKEHSMWWKQQLEERSPGVPGNANSE